ncbi:murein biosynthesis integral membrane protein MurJ [Agromyces atrinae]|uniref:Murein biosynthesis integral membrane protein MurJ n=1 Tax=Agromyces atrinae TaxID=592376 RepID=A0A4V1R2Q6_9MICO|nr:murein biosynthesis integral membrane protein MurJ [Agromyces atrinae]NYD67836.1 putative peptidoglycan lipid II flippase [Agromyces atrinae]RXZ87986.1 murein biosynthesis integral membrane protein MurJ [Agromyces atrinae]
MSERGIGRASFFLASGTIVSRVLGFVKAIVLVAAIGQTGGGPNAFAIANGLPNAIYVIVAGGVLSAVLVPQIVRAGVNPDGGAAYINKLLTLALTILAATTVVALALAPALVFVYGPQLDEASRHLAIAFALWCLPQIFFYGLYTLLGEVLNARKSFGPFTWAPVINNVIAIAGLVAVMVIYGDTPLGLPPADWSAGLITILAGSATLGIVAQALILFYFWHRIGLRYRPDFRWRGVGLGAAGKMASWTFGMLLLTTVAGIVSSAVLSSTADLPGVASVATLDYAWLIFMLPHSVITVSIATAYFTRMSEHAHRGDTDSLRSDVSAAIRGIGLIIVLAAAGLVLVSSSFAAVFQPGLEGAEIMGPVIVVYVIGLIPFSILFVVQRAFYALGDTRTPFFFTLFQVVLFIGGAVLCLGVRAEWIGIGIALSTTFAGIAQLILAIILLRRRLGGMDLPGILASYLRYLLAVILPVIAGFIIFVAFGGLTEDSFALESRPSAIITMIVIGSAMSLLYVLGLWLVRSPEFRGFAEPVIRRLRRR